MPLAICELCPRAVTLPSSLETGAVVACRPPRTRGAADDFDETRVRIDVAEAAARTHVGELLSSAATCVRPESDLEAVVELLDEGATCVPVVDDSGKLVGVVRGDDVLRALRDLRDHESSRSPRALGPGFHVQDETLTVGDVADASTTALGESTPIALALAVLVESRHCALPVVNDSKTVVGVLSTIDVARWIARRLGYAIQTTET